MHRRSAIWAANPHPVHGAACALFMGLALLGPQADMARAADAGAVSTATQALAHQTQRLANDAGQFYLAWWIPEALSQAILRDTPNAAHAGSLQALQPYIVFALSRAQVGDKGLVDLHDKADLLRASRLTVNGQVISAVPADPNDPGAQAALEMIKPALAAMLGRFDRGIEFALYRPAAGTPVPDPTLVGSMEFKLYHKRFSWQLPVWAPASPSEAVAAAPVPAAPVAVSAAAASIPMAPAPAPSPMLSNPVAPLPPPPVQHRKIDPTSGEEFPERYNYNPYTGQKLVSQ